MPNDDLSNSDTEDVPYQECRFEFTSWLDSNKRVIVMDEQCNETRIDANIPTKLTLKEIRIAKILIGDNIEGEIYINNILNASSLLPLTAPDSVVLDNCNVESVQYVKSYAAVKNNHAKLVLDTHGCIVDMDAITFMNSSGWGDMPRIDLENVLDYVHANTETFHAFTHNRVILVNMVQQLIKITSD